MPQTAISRLGQIHALLANKRYSVTDLNDSVLKIQELESGITLRAVLEGDILFLSLVCMTVPAAQLTAPVMRKMLAADNGISTSHFQLLRRWQRKCFCHPQQLLQIARYGRRRRGRYPLVRQFSVSRRHARQATHWRRSARCISAK